MLQIDQFVHTLQYGDAISGEALSIQRLLRNWGYKSEIYSVNTHQKLLNIPKKMGEFDGAAKRDALILHYSISSPQNLIYSTTRHTKRFLIYHNLTPTRWFSNYNYRVTQDLIMGKEELPGLISQTDICLADSKFNAEELKAFGANNAETLPLLVDPARWECSPNQGIIDALQASQSENGGKNILHVGRIAPNKCIEDIIKSFYFYHHKFDKTSRLWLIGHDTDTEIYSFELRKLVDELRLKESVFFVGSVSDDELMGFYKASDLYLCMSEHEGFCVPLIEALHHELPVIAYASSAIPETLGDAGILLEQKDPLKTALIMRKILSDKALLKEIKETGANRAQAFSLDNFSINLKNQVINKL